MDQQHKDFIRKVLDRPRDELTRILVGLILVGLDQIESVGLEVPPQFDVWRIFITNLQNDVFNVDQYSELRRSIRDLLNSNKPPYSQSFYIVHQLYTAVEWVVIIVRHGHPWSFDYVNSLFGCMDGCFNMLMNERINAEAGYAMVKNMIEDAIRD